MSKLLEEQGTEAAAARRFTTISGRPIRPLYGPADVADLDPARDLESHCGTEGPRPLDPSRGAEPMHFAAGVADQIHVLNRGRIVHSSSPTELLANEDVKSRFLGLGT